MAVEAPLHAQRFNLMNDFHRVDSTMTFNTAHTAIDMSGVVEECIVRKVVNSNPLDRHARFITVKQWFQLWAFRMNLKVTVHAGLCRRNCCMRAVFNSVVTIPTVDTQFTGMNRMTEWNRLRWHVPHVGGLRTESPGDHEDHIRWSRHAHDDDHRQKQVGPTWKYKVVTTHEPCP